MPKSSKKKKDKAADFSKAKLKLGKGKQVASNAVDTSFKSRSIALPTQSIAHERNTATPSTKRRLTFDDLIAQLKHYNAGTRRDAILGLRELLEEHPDLIVPSLTVLFSGCVRIIGDEDASVRKILLSFLSWLLPQIPKDDLVPHSPILLLFTTSAQTHIFPEIRIDAIRFLDLLLEHIPDVVTEGWTYRVGGHGRRVLEGYLGILNAGTVYGGDAETGPVQATSTASVVLSPASKLAVLKSFATFLARALTSHSLHHDGYSSTSLMQTPTWFLSSSFSSAAAFSSFNSLLMPSQTASTSRIMVPSPFMREWLEEIETETLQEDFVGHFDAVDGHGATWSLDTLTNIDFTRLSSSLDGGESSSGTDADTSHVAHLARTLHPTLVSTFLDCAPTVFSPNSHPPETELQLVLSVAQLTQSLYGHLLQGSGKAKDTRETSCEELSAILGYMSPYFPFTVVGPSTVRRDIKIEQTFQDLNLIYCELTSLLVLASSDFLQHPRPGFSRRGTARQSSSKRPASHFSPGISALQVKRVSEYVMRLLRGEVPTGPGTPNTLPRPISATAYVSLLPTIWALINSTAHEPSGATSSDMLEAVVQHACKASSSSAVKRHTIDFVGRLLLLEGESEYHGALRIGRSSRDDAILQDWLLQLPKTLWELGASNLPATETILRLLLRLSQRRSSLLHHKTVAAIRSRIVPFFTISHATRGKLQGPFAKLPHGSPLRRLALDVAATLCLMGPETDSDGLDAAVHEAVAGDDKTYWASLSVLRRS